MSKLGNEKQQQELMSSLWNGDEWGPEKVLQVYDPPDDGRYKITMKGLDMIKDLESVHNVFQKQFEVLLRVGSRGRFMTLDLLDRITNIGSALSSNLDKMTEQERNRYRHFLKTELRKVDQQQTQESNNINKNGE